MAKKILPAKFDEKKKTHTLPWITDNIKKKKKPNNKFQFEISG